jgi:transcriptional regulator CtsR
MRISDIIEDFIKKMLLEDDSAIIQRNDLAEHFKCVPSQINYVIATRFTPNQGYYVESQRGGGGYIKISRVNLTQSDYLMHIISNLGDKITAKEVDILINNFIHNGIINEDIARLIKSATSDKALTIPLDIRDSIRAKIFKNMLINLV